MKKGVFKNIFIWFGLIMFDIAVYFILAMLLIQYDDFYDESMGEYWSLESMNFWQKVNYIGLNVWHLINLVLIGYLIYRFIKKLRKTPYNNVYSA